MNKKKVIRLLLIAIVLLLIPKSVVLADTVNLYKSSYTPYKDEHTYRTKGYVCNSNDGVRKLSLFHQYHEKGKKDDGPYYICIDYGKEFKEGTFTIKKFYINSDTSKQVPSLLAYRETCSSDARPYTLKNNAADLARLEKALSCYNATSKRSSFAMQAISWELISQERTAKFDPDKIYPGAKAAAYDPNNVLSNGLYKSIIYKYRNESEASAAIYSEYKRILECAARFNVTPSGTGKTITMNQKTAPTSNKKATYSATNILKLNNKPAQSNLYAYYLCQIGSTKKPCRDGVTAKGVTFKCNSTYCSATTDQDYAGGNVEVTFIYAYKKASDYKSDKNGTLNTHETDYYSKDDSQVVVRGSYKKTFSITLKKGEAQKYALRIKKVDSANKTKVLQGAKFSVYTTETGKTPVSGCKDIATDKNGIAVCSGLSIVGTYYVEETQAPSGYSIISPGKRYKVTVGSNDTVSNVNNITPKEVTNKQNKIIMNKQAVDENNNPVPLEDACKVKECPTNTSVGGINGPVFTVTTNDNKYVCVKESSAGKYTYVNTAATCTGTGVTNYIQTCDGKFEIAGIPSANYTITEKAGACGTTVDSNPTRTCSKALFDSGSDCTVTMINGFTGVMFYKQNEAGILIEGGKYSLQQKQNGIYTDVPLTLKEVGVYEYTSGLAPSSDNTILTTDAGKLNVKGLPVGEYRFVEKEAPEGYDAIKDKDSTAVFTISDANKPVETILINSKSKTQGSYDSAELIVTIITGRKVINYIAIIGGLGALLAALLLLRKKFKK